LDGLGIRRVQELIDLRKQCSASLRFGGVAEHESLVVEFKCFVKLTHQRHNLAARCTCGLGSLCIDNYLTESWLKVVNYLRCSKSDRCQSQHR
jgi:hypothetical protein